MVPLNSNSSSCLISIDTKQQIINNCRPFKADYDKRAAWQETAGAAFPKDVDLVYHGTAIWDPNWLEIGEHKDFGNLVFS